MCVRFFLFSLNQYRQHSVSSINDGQHSSTSRNEGMYSTKEVVRDNFHDAPKPDRRQQPDKEALALYKPAVDSDDRKRRLCGMRRPIAFAVTGIITLVIVAAVVGGTVGGIVNQSDTALRLKASYLLTTLRYHQDPAPTGTAEGVATTSAGSASSSISTPFTTSTPLTSSTSSSPESRTSTFTSSAPASATSGMGSYDCPSSNKKYYVTSSDTGGLPFVQLCGIDWPYSKNATSTTPLVASNKPGSLLLSTTTEDGEAAKGLYGASAIPAELAS